MTTTLVVPVLRESCGDSPSFGWSKIVVREPCPAVGGTVYCCNVPSLGDQHAHTFLPPFFRRVLRQSGLGALANGVCVRRPLVGWSRRRKQRGDAGRARVTYVFVTIFHSEPVFPPWRVYSCAHYSLRNYPLQHRFLFQPGAFIRPRVPPPARPRTKRSAMARQRPRRPALTR
jgi:hypothetical protein